MPSREQLKMTNEQWVKLAHARKKLCDMARLQMPESYHQAHREINNLLYEILCDGHSNPYRAGLSRGITGEHIRKGVTRL
jgi:hypothetical protein